MKRFSPFLIFLVVTAALVTFIYKDKIFPLDEQGKDSERSAQGGSSGGGRRNGGSGGGRQGGGGGHRRGNQIVPVLVDTAKTDNVPVYLTGVGTVQAHNTSTVRAQVSGRLTEINFKEGQDVQAGDVLAKLDPVLFKAAYDQVVAKKAQDEALLANSKLDEKRYAGLAKAENVSQQQADTAKATVQQNEAQIKQDQAMIDNALANLEYASIKAPISGKTGIRLVDVGNLVSAADANGIVVIAQLKPISVVFTLPEDTIAEMLDAMAREPVPVQAITNGTVIGEGTLLVIDNQIDQTTGTVRLKATFGNDQNKLWPGLFVNAKLRLKILKDAIVVPSVAIQQGSGGSYVYIVVDDKVKLTNVKVRQEGENRAVIAEGVKPGDVIVTSGFASLQDGTKIRVDTDKPAENKVTAPNDQNADEKGKRKHRRDQKEGASNDAAPRDDKNKAQEAAADTPPVLRNQPGTGAQ